VFYGNMPKFGLGAAMEHTVAVGRRKSARLRLSPIPVQQKIETF